MRTCEFGGVTLDARYGRTGSVVVVQHVQTDVRRALNCTVIQPVCVWAAFTVSHEWNHQHIRKWTQCVCMPQLSLTMWCLPVIKTSQSQCVSFALQHCFFRWYHSIYTHSHVRYRNKSRCISIYEQRIKVEILQFRTLCSTVNAKCLVNYIT